MSDTLPFEIGSILVHKTPPYFEVEVLEYSKGEVVLIVHADARPGEERSPLGHVYSIPVQKLQFFYSKEVFDREEAFKNDINGILNE